MKKYFTFLLHILPPFFFLPFFILFSLLLSQLRVSNFLASFPIFHLVYLCFLFLYGDSGRPYSTACPLPLQIQSVQLYLLYIAVYNTYHIFNSFLTCSFHIWPYKAHPSSPLNPLISAASTCLSRFFFSTTDILPYSRVVQKEGREME